MAPPPSRTEGKRLSSDSLSPPPLQPQDDVDVYDEEEAEVSMDYRCPFYWGDMESCPWIGGNWEMQQHFENLHGDIIEVKDVNGPTLCEWSNYEQACDVGGEENGFYRLLMKTSQHMVFFLSAKVNNNGITGIHVIYIGEPKRAHRYSCSVTIENRGDEAAGPITLRLATGPTDGISDIITINQEIGEMLWNEELRNFCAENGSLYFTVELQIPQGEIEDVNHKKSDEEEQQQEEEEL